MEEFMEKINVLEHRIGMAMRGFNYKMEKRVCIGHRKVMGWNSKLWNGIKFGNILSDHKSFWSLYFYKYFLGFHTRYIDGIIYQDSLKDNRSRGM